MKPRIKAVKAIMLALMCAGTPLVPAFADLIFLETGAAAWCVRRGCARDPMLAARQVTEAADGIRVTLDAAESDLKPWSWGSINATRNIHLENVQNGAVVQLRFRCSNPPLVGNDVTIGIEDAASNRVPLVRLSEGIEGGISVISYRIDYSRRKVADEPKPPFFLKYINFGMENERGSVTFISIKTKPPPIEKSAATLSLDVETGNPLHIIRTNLAERAVLTFSNRCGKAQCWTGMMTMADRNGHRISSKLSFALDADAVHLIALSSPLPGMGVWNVKAELKCDDGTSGTYSTRFAQIDHHAVTPKLPYGKYRFGVVYHITNYGPEDRTVTLEAITAMGAKIARVGGLWYYHYEHERGHCDWSVADGIVNDLERRGVAICAGCYANPPWALKADGSKAARFGSAAPGLQGGFLEKLSRRFGERIDYYEIGNEWDLKSASDMTVEDGIRVTRECAEAIKRGCPSARVIPSGWAVESSAHPMVRQKGFQERVMKECSDVLDAHPIHVHGPWPMHVSRMRDFFAMRANGGIELPWFANETAVSSVYGREETAAETLWRKIVWSWAHGSTDYCWYNLRATGDDEFNAEHGYGLLTRDYHPRDGFAAFSALATLLEGFDFSQRFENPSGRVAYLFTGRRNDVDEKVLVAWDRPGGDGFTLNLQASCDGCRRLAAMAVDLYGNRNEVKPCGKEMVWRVDARPCALMVCGAGEILVDESCLAADNPVVRSIRCGRGEPSRRAAELTIDDYSQVTEIFQANPELMHRLWKGVNDVSAVVWFTLDDDSVVVNVAVTDDIDAQSDGAFVRIGKDAPLQMERMSRQGVTTTYSARFSSGRLPDMASVTVDDDDGEGTEVRISETVNVLK